MTQEIKMTLPRIGCQGCVRKVVGVLSNLPSVEVVSTDVATKSVHVRYDEDCVGFDQFTDALQRIGHVIQMPETEAVER